MADTPSLLPIAVVEKDVLDRNKDGYFTYSQLAQVLTDECIEFVKGTGFFFLIPRDSN